MCRSIEEKRGFEVNLPRTVAVVGRFPGQAGARQVAGAKTALLENAGLGGLNVMIFQR